MKLLCINLFLPLILAPICNAIPNTSSKHKRILYLLITGCQLFIIHALKDWYSLPDLPEYEDIFYRYANNMPLTAIEEMSVEPGYKFINYIITRISGSLTFFSIFISLIIIGCYLYTINKYSNIIWLSILLFICQPFLQSLFVIRQHLAVAICILSIPYILKRQIIKFYILILIALSIHISAIIFIPAYYLYLLPIKKNFWRFLILVSILGFIFAKILFISLISFTGLYQAYLEEGREGLSNLTPALVAASPLIVAYFCSRIQNYKGIEKLSFIMGCITFILSLSGIGLPLIPRLTLYYSVFSILFIPIMISKMKKNNKIIVTTALVGLYSLLYISTLRGPSLENYKTISIL